MNRTFRYLFIPLLAPVLFAQEDLYPAEAFYGGGVGFSQMFLYMDIKNEFDLLGTVVETVSDSITITRGLGLEQKFSYPFVVSGGEGFSQITGRWRLGGYAGLGASQISDRPTIFLYIDDNTNGVLDISEQETLTEYSGGNAPDVQAKFSLWLGGITAEYIFPLFSGFEISPGVLFGAGKANLSITQGARSPYWNSIFSTSYDLGSNLIVVEDMNGDSTIDGADILLAQDELEFNIGDNPVSMMSLSGSFLSIQPYLAFKLQFMDRVGVRISVGVNLGKIKQGTWILNDRDNLSDSPETKLNSLAIRAMIYFGL